MSTGWIFAASKERLALMPQAIIVALLIFSLFWSPYRRSSSERKTRAQFEWRLDRFFPLGLCFYGGHGMVASCGGPFRPKKYISSDTEYLDCA
jgi:hypothetical protein